MTSLYTSKLSVSQYTKTVPTSASVKPQYSTVVKLPVWFTKSAYVLLLSLLPITLEHYSSVCLPIQPTVKNSSYHRVNCCLPLPKPYLYLEPGEKTLLLQVHLHSVATTNGETPYKPTVWVTALEQTREDSRKSENWNNIPQ